MPTSKAWQIVVVASLCAPNFTESPDTVAPPLVRFQQGNKFGFKDETGQVRIEPIYDDAGSFSCGFCPVNRGAFIDDSFHPPFRHGGKWGYINTNGNVVIPLTWSGAHDFSDDVARVYDGGGFRYLNKDGKTVITLGPVFCAGDFREGLAPIVPLNDPKSNEGERTVYIDKKGKKLFDIGCFSGEFHDGLAVAHLRVPSNCKTSTCGYIDRTGTFVIQPLYYEAFDFHDGLAGVRTTKTNGLKFMGDTWGYIDTRGRIVIAPRYNETHPFRKGVARVHIGGELHEFSAHAPPSWKGGEWQLIDKSGKILKRSQEFLEYEESSGKDAVMRP